MIEKFCINPYLKLNFSDKELVSVPQKLREKVHMTWVNIRWYDEICVQHAGIELAS